MGVMTVYAGWLEIDMGEKIFEKSKQKFDFSEKV